MMQANQQLNYHTNTFKHTNILLRHKFKRVFVVVMNVIVEKSLKVMLFAYFIILSYHVELFVYHIYSKIRRKICEKKTPSINRMQHA